MAPRSLCRLAVLASVTAMALLPSSTANAARPNASPANAGTANAGTANAGTANAGTANAGTANAGTANAGTANAGTANAGTANAGTANAGTANAGRATAAGDGTADLIGPLPITAAAGMSGANGCTDWATGPNADLDLWRFRLDAGAFVSAELVFADADGMPVSRNVDGIDGGTAWIATAAGWSLTAGTAVVTDGMGHFELARACPAATSARPGAVGGLAPAIGGRAGTGARPASGQGGTTIPKSLAAGTDIAATVTMGAALVLAGLLLLIVRRRPRGRHRMREAR